MTVMYFHTVRHFALCLVMTAWGFGLPVPAAAQKATHFPYTNRLIHSADPYLLLHAHNPVDWYPWGPAALAKARRENKPIFLSIGYSTCYWCHVAERTLYSDPAIAKLMNAWFVNIKVDREQRPDLDRLYLLATALMTGQSAWPNNLFLTPDRKPFFAGSYFSPKNDAFGRPGFPAVLTRIHQEWAHHPQTLRRRADQVFAAMRRMQGRLAGGGRDAPITPAAWLAKARRTLTRQFDAQYGGFAAAGQETKFPEPARLMLLLADARQHHHPASLAMLEKTLDAMAYGGIDDQLGGGFRRYSVERTWSLPHFEKMLYDNAQLMLLYAEASQATRRPLYRWVTQRTAAYLQREMMSPAGGFYTAQDAQVDGEEGKSAIWTRGEITAILGHRQARRFFRVYALTPLTRQTDAHLLSGDPAGVLRIRRPIVQTLRRANAAQISQRLDALAPQRTRLLAARRRRPQPARDDKILTGLNGLAITAFARGGQLFANAHWISIAERSAQRVWALAYQPQEHTLLHTIFHGKARTAGYLDDYALLGNSFLTLYQITKHPRWLNRAITLAGAIETHFSRPDGGLATAVQTPDLLLPPIADGDTPVPSGVSAAVRLLLRLTAITGNPSYATRALAVVRRLRGQLDDQPSTWAAMITAINRYPLPITGKAIARAPRPDTASHLHAAMTTRAVNGHDEIQIILRIDPGYHVNAHPATFDYLVPTTVAFTRLTPLAIHYPPPVPLRTAFAADTLAVYQGTVTVTAVFPAGALAKPREIRATLTAQACTDHTCLPPAKIPLTLGRPPRPQIQNTSPSRRE